MTRLAVLPALRSRGAAAAIAAGGIAVAALAVPMSASATTAPTCEESAVSADYLGLGVFSASAEAHCEVNISSFVFDDPEFSPDPEDDIYGYSQTEFATVRVTLGTTPAEFSVPIPECDVFQADLYIGEPREALADGDLEPDFIAGDVDYAGDCPGDGGTEEPSPTPSNPPVSGSPIPEPSISPTTEPTPSVPLPSEPAAGTPSPTTAPTAASPAAVAPSAVAPTATAAPALAETGADSRMIGAGVVSAAALLAAGLILLILRRRRGAH
ncbi:MAG: hypothetical protein RI885_2621 [Actinomycetota bacterium]|jgi:hypothetical protein